MYDIFVDNLKRVDSLLTIYQGQTNKNIGDSKSTDILRASIVLLHSSFEDYFRGIIINYLIKTTDANSLSRMPLILGDNKVEKVFLSNLLQYKEKTIQEVFDSSIKQYMETISFNDYADIVKWCNTIKVNLTTFSEASFINDLISRRHKIVHQADLIVDCNGVKKLSSMSMDWIVKRKQSVINLVELIHKQE